MHRPTIVGSAGPEGNHFHTFCGWPPFFHCSRRCRTMSRACAFYGRQILFQDLFHTPVPPALPHAHSSRRISWNFDTSIAFEAYKLIIA